MNGGQGYSAADMPSTLPWIGSVAVGHWGDIDTHGLAILDPIRPPSPAPAASSWTGQRPAPGLDVSGRRDTLMTWST